MGLSAPAAARAAYARLLITADSTGGLNIWEFNSKTAHMAHTYILLRELRPSVLRGISIVSVRVRPAAGSHGHPQMAVLAQSDMLRLFDLTTFAPLRAYANAHCSGSRLEATWSPDGRLLCAGSEDGVMAIWDGDTGSSIPARAHTAGGSRVVLGYPSRVMSVAWSPTAHACALAAFGGEYPVMLCT